VSDDVLYMPRLGESIVEATIVRWAVQPGDDVQAGDVVVEVETDKATNEIPAPKDGRVASLEARAGETLPVGAPLLRYTDATGPQASPSPGAARSSSEVAAPHFDLEHGPSRLAPRPTTPEGTPIPCAPSARRRARIGGVDLRRVQGTGRRGRITRADVEAFLERTPGSGSSPGEDHVVFLSGRRKKIAEALRKARDTAVQVFALAEIDLGRVETARARAKEAGRPLSPMPFLVQGVLQAMEVQPELNATLVGERMTLHAEKNIGIAVDTEHGLVVPVLHGADRFDLDELGGRIRELAERARRRELKPADLDGGTFTISNPGRDGNLVGVSILRTPEVGILRTGAVTKRPVVRTVDGEDHISIRPMMMAALTYDHRAIDGRTGNRFLSALKDALEIARFTSMVPAK